MKLTHWLRSVVKPSMHNTNDKGITIDIEDSSAKYC